MSTLYVDDIFNEVSILHPDLREAALADRCQGHPSVEAEVRALLHAMEDGSPASERGALEPGAQLGRYRLEQRIGEGATASVWKAWDTHLQVWTALKLLHPGGPMRGPKALDAVMHEARAASGILSDHVVRIKTAGQFAGGLHFIEMELCAEHRPGSDGAEVLEVGRTLNETSLHGTDELVRVVAEAARGVDAAHRLGVLHRDLKPSNILLTPISHRAQVTDFGLAAPQLHAEPTVDTSPTETVTVMLEAQDGKLVGTPCYMAPEQAFGQPPTRASDIYGLGATLWAMLAERAPYTTGTDHAVPALDVVAQVRTGPPKPLRAVAPAVPRRLARIVERAMRRSPRQRYATAGDLAADLEAWLARRPTSVDGVNPLLSLGLTLRRNREVTASSAVLIAILVVFAGSLAWLDVRKDALEYSIAEAVAQRARVRVEADAAARVRVLAEADRDLAVAEASAAREARAAAERSEAGAEERSAIASRRARQAETARVEAEEAMTAAVEAQGLAEAQRQAAQQRVGELEVQVDSETQRARAAVAVAEDARVRRDLAEEALEDARRVLGEREAALASLAEVLDSERLGREQAEVELARLEAALIAARQAFDAIPQPVAVEPIAADARLIP